MTINKTEKETARQMEQIKERLWGTQKSQIDCGGHGMSQIDGGMNKLETGRDGMSERVWRELIESERLMKADRCRVERLIRTN